MPSTLLRGSLAHREYSIWELALLQCFNRIRITPSSPAELTCAFASLLQLLSPGRRLLLPVPGSQPALDAGQVLPPGVPLRVQEPAGSARAGGELGPARLLLVLLLTGDAAAAPAALGQEPALAHLQLLNYCVSNPCDLLLRVLVPKSCGDVQGERMLCAGKAQS